MKFGLPREGYANAKAVLTHMKEVNSVFEVQYIILY
jgi:hypothetical protein